MSTFRHPVGPQPASTYWRRRILVLLGLIALVVAIALIVIRPGAGAPATEPDPASSESETSDPSASSDPAASADPAASPELSASSDQPAEEAVEGAECDPDALEVAAITDTNNYAEGALPLLSFSITNTSGTACTFNVGTTQQTFEITSGEELYWSSKDCETAPVDAPVLLEPNVAQTSSPITWDRTRSSKTTCDTERPAVPAGGATYYLGVTIGELETSRRSFLLY